MDQLPKGALIVATRKDGQPVFEGKWWHGEQVKRRLGPAWLERGQSSSKRRQTRFSGWIRREGKAADGYLDERAAERRMEAAIAAHAADQEQAERALRFEDAADSWLKSRKRKKDWKPSTERDYRAMLRQPDEAARKRGKPPKARVMKAFAGRELASITSPDIEDFLGELADAKLTNRSINKHRQLLSGIFTEAVENKWITENPVPATAKRTVRGQERIVYSPEQIQSIAREADEQTGAAILTAGFAGLRAGELLALRWRHINFSGQSLHVQRALSAGKETGTKGGDARVVPMATQVAQVLAKLGQREHFTRQSDLVFCNQTGGFLNDSALRRRYKAARDRAIEKDSEIPSLRFHDLRHSFGSASIQGFNPAQVKAIMGHKDIRTTEQYLHARSSERDADVLTTLFNGASADERAKEPVRGADAAKQPA